MRSSKTVFHGLVEEARICATCGSCRSVCPVYAEIGWESAAPRGKITLAKKIFVEGKENFLSEQYVKRVFQCTLCGSCAEVCPARIDTRELWQEMRQAITDRGKAPTVFNQIAKNIHNNKNISANTNDGRLDWADDLDDPECIEPSETNEVGYFVGCVASFYPMVSEIPLSFVNIMDINNVKVTVLGTEEWCCGFPLLAAGRNDEALSLVEHNVLKIGQLGIKTLVTTCPSCYHTFSHHYPKVIGKPLDFEVVHATQYLSYLIEQGKLDWSEYEELDEVVTYHDPCDLGRNSGIYDAPRNTLKNIPGVTFVEMEHNRENALCCGGGGNLQAVDPELTAAIAESRIEEALKTGATTLVSACQQCVQVLTEAARRKKARIQVMDINQLLWMGWE
ncbi:MAG: (Fe-S)-binding protein [Thermoanaerobacteraceae bacterium]|nr:(Fe-S)-binding protein [Thermoanaerobacteraceae bacterium]